MSTKYDYSLTSDFTNASQVDLYYLKILINKDVNVTIQVDYINKEDDVVSIYMTSALSEPQKTALDSLISSYTYMQIPSQSSSILFDAYVSNNEFNPGDYTTISEAFTDGKKSVFVKNGIYYESSDIIIPDRGQLVGETPGHVYIILIGGARIICDAINTNPNETTGTITITNNTSSVVGSGTTFTNLSPGQFILIGTNYFPIASITDDTHLSVSDTHHGKDIVGQTLKAHTVYSGIKLDNMILYGSTTEALYIRGVRNSSFSCLAVYNCGKGVIMKDSSDLSIISLVINHCMGTGFEIESCYSLSLNIVNNYNNNGDGFLISGDSFNINIQTCTSEANGGHGFYFKDTSNLINLTDTVIKYNTLDGILMDPNTRFISMSSVESSNNGGNGITLKGKNTFVGDGFILNNTGNGIETTSVSFCCAIESNTIGYNAMAGIKISGESTTIISNHIGQCGNGIILNSINSTSVCSNVVKDSGSKGILVENSSNRVIISNNVVEQCTTKSIEIDSSSSYCIVSTNIVDKAIDNQSTGSVVVNNINVDGVTFP